MKSKSLSSELFISIVKIYVVIMLIVTVAHIVVEYSYNKHQINQELIGIGETFSPILETALWDINEEQLSSTSKGMMNIDIIYGITIKELNGKVLVKHEDPIHVIDGKFHNEEISYTFVISHKYKNEDIYLATVTLYSDRCAVLDRLKVGFFMLFINAVIKSTALVLLFIIAFRKHLGVPLKELTEEIEKFSWHNKGKREINVAFRSKNELSYLLAKFNKLLSLITAEEKKHKELSEKYTKELERTVEARTRDLEELNQKLAKLAQTDALTGTSNRSKLENELKVQFEHYRRYGRMFSVILIDIDHFKKINDTYGHNMGDNVLCQIATVLKNNTRSTDSVGRWGGEEFLIICSETTKEDALKLAEILRSNISQLQIEGLPSITASFGVSEINKGHMIHELIAEADIALYHSKASGRNMCTLYSGILKYKNNGA